MVIIFVAKIFCFWKKNSSSGQPPLMNHCCIHAQVFHQKFCMPSIPGAVQFFRLAISFFIFSSVKANSLTRFALLPSLAFFSSIHSIFDVGLFCSQMSLQNSTNPASRAFFDYFQSLKKIFFVSLERDVMFLPIMFFNLFLQHHLLVTKLIKPLLLKDS